MFWSFLQYLSIKRLGLARPILIVSFIVLFFCLLTGIIYAAVVFRAVNNQKEVHRVQHHAKR